MLVHAHVTWQNSGVCCGIHQQHRLNVKLHRMELREECENGTLLHAIPQGK